MQLLFKPNDVRSDKLERPKGRDSSRIRDHLANERTYLAWMRTAIALMGLGIVIVRLRMLQPPVLPGPGNSWKLGLVFSLVGLGTVWLSTQHYFSIRDAINNDHYEPADRWIVLFSLVLTLLGAGVMYYVFTVPLNPLNNFVFE